MLYYIIMYYTILYYIILYFLGRRQRIPIEEEDKLLPNDIAIEQSRARLFIIYCYTSTVLMFIIYLLRFT